MVKKKLLVFCDSRAQFLRFLNENGLAPGGAFHITKAMHLRGFSREGVLVLFYGPCLDVDFELMRKARETYSYRICSRHRD